MKQKRYIMKQVIILFLGLIISVGLNAQSSDCKCCTDKNSEFDFWVGSWNVTNKKGDLAGTSVIEKIQDNCIISENWKSAKGTYTGMSSNFYNTKTDEWEQMWLDNQGGSLHLKGKRVGNQMILQTDEVLNKEGKTFVNRITWTANDDGTVSQLWEMITDGDITVAFDGLYKKVKY